MSNCLGKVKHAKSETVALLESHFCKKKRPCNYMYSLFIHGRKKSNFDTIFTTLSSGVEDFGRRN